MMISSQHDFLQNPKSENHDDGSKQDIVYICSLLAKNHSLTYREQEVLLELVQGLQIKEIAAKFTVSKNTVRSQVQSLYHKLDVHNRNELQALIEQTNATQSA
jgi:DNA-binding NarL/FixJ family response regulator